MKSRTTTTKPTTTTKAKTTAPKPAIADTPIPFRPARIRLAPIVGELGPKAQPAKCVGGPVDVDVAAERTALRSTKAEGGDRWALVDTLLEGLGDSMTETPLALATDVLESMSAELRVLSTALGAYDVDLWPYQSAVDSMARRAEMVAHLALRIEQARNPKLDAVAPPPPHEVAGALLTLPGVLTGAPDALERVLRVADCLDVEVVTSGPMVDTAPLGSSVYLTWPREQGGPNMPAIVVRLGDDVLTTVANLLGHAVAKREGYPVDNTWCRELGSALVGSERKQDRVAS